MFRKQLLNKIYKYCNRQRLCEIVKCDETWIHYYEPRRKINNRMWLTKKGKCHVIAKRYKVQRKYYT